VRGLLLITVLGVVIAAGCGGSQDLSVTVSPAEGLIDAPFDVDVSGADAGDPVTITITARSNDGRPWQATRKARADDNGEVELRDAYLMARLRPVAARPSDDGLPLPLTLTFEASDGTDVARAHAKRLHLPASVKVERKHGMGFYGVWFVPRGASRQTTILLLGGSEGGLSTSDIAGTLAGHGYPVLALAYFGHPGLPREAARIPLEYFERALGWLREQEAVDPDRIVTFGISLGGELALLLGSRFPSLVHSVVAYVPSAEVLASLTPGAPAWTLRGEPVREGPIPVERIAGPVFAVGAVADMLSTSSSAVYAIEERFEANGRDDLTALVYPHAGHGVGSALPNLYVATSGDFPPYGRIYLGGTPAVDERAREDSWPKLLQFLEKL
jgi:dienelactone hydrolase